MDHAEIESLRERHPAWRLLRAGNAPLILAFLGGFFVEANRGACPAAEVTSALDDLLFDLNTASPALTALPGSGGDGTVPAARYPKEARAYLDDWSAADAAFLRRFFPSGHDEIHYEVTPAFEKAYAWVTALRSRGFVGTESRLHTVVALLRQIVHGTETDPEARLAELRRRRDEIDAEIAEVEAGHIAVLDRAGVRDRYQQFATTARELLADFREVEENFRTLDRAAREKIATWSGSKGELLADLIGNRSHITDSDQGRSFQAFYDYLLSHSRQEELSELLASVATQPDLAVDPRMRGIHYQWARAAERTQRTVRQISEQLRRFLDDAVWVENRRVFDLVREIEAAALALRSDPPRIGLAVDDLSIDIALPMERPLYQRPAAVAVNSSIIDADDGADPELLFKQAFIDQARLAEHIRSLLPERSSALLTDIVDMFPLEQGAAEIVGYLALADDDIAVELDDVGESVLHYPDPSNMERTVTARMPTVTVTRT